MDRARHNGACLPCDAYATGANCSRAGSTLTGLVSARGWWRATALSSVFHPCNPLDKGVCRGHAVDARERPESPRDAQCRPGHVGPKCGACDWGRGYVRKLDGQCEQCSTSDRVRAAVLACLAVALLICLARHLQRGRTAEILKQGWEKRVIKLRILFGFSGQHYRITRPVVAMHRCRCSLHVYAGLAAVRLEFVAHQLVRHTPPPQLTDRFISKARLPV